MSNALSTDRRSGLKSKLLDQLHDPVRLRVFVIGVVLAAGYFAVYEPLQSRIAGTEKKLARDKKMLKTAAVFEQLQQEYSKLGDRIPQNTDSKEWVQYVLDGTRLFPLKLLKLDCQEPRRASPYLIIHLKVELEGNFADLDKFLRWVESNHRLLRVDNISISPARGENNVSSLRMNIIGLSG